MTTGEREQAPLDVLVKSIAALPGLGPRSARRIALHLLMRKEKSLRPLIGALERADAQIGPCSVCGNLDARDPCRVCADPHRAPDLFCVVADVADLWAIERTGAFRGRYHVLGGVLSALNGVSPADLKIDGLLARVAAESPAEIILALSATVDGQTTAHYLTDRIRDLADVTPPRISRLAHGVPVGGELGYLDDGTITTALKSRAPLK